MSVDESHQDWQEISVKLGQTSINGFPITENHFGGNYALDRAEDLNAIGANGNFDEVTEDLGVNFFRYPGGTVTEKYFNLSDPNFVNAELELRNKVTPMDEFLKEAAKTNAEVSFVLPTFDYYAAILNGSASELEAAKGEVSRFVTSLMEGEYGHLIKIFEIGNEFWAFDEMGGNSNAETDIITVHKNYGIVASRIAEWVQQALDSTSNDLDPLITVQASIRSQNLNDLIIQEFSPSEFDSIDGVVNHLYADVPWTQNQDRLDAKSNLVDSWETNSGKELAHLITEWNVRSWQGVDGMLQAAGLLEMFTSMIQSGVDVAIVWPISQTNQSALSFGIDGGDLTSPTELTPAGIAYKMLAESTVGLRSVEQNSNLSLVADGTTEEGVYEVTSRGDYTSGDLLEFGEADALIHMFDGQSGNKLVVFISSLEGENTHINLDLSSYGISQSYDHLWGSKLVVPWGSPLRPWTRAHVQSLTANDLEGEFENDGVFSLNFNPFEIIRLEFTFGESVELEADNYSSQNDTLEGTGFDDKISGFGGADTISGRDGSDEIFGGEGADVLFGGRGEDRILGGERQDKLHGNDGNDKLLGGDGADRIYGGDGDDTLLGGTNLGESVDGLFGGTGDDTLFGDGGFDHLEGGDGKDRLFGGNQADNLYGGSGEDGLFGGDGFDRLFGGDGDDYLDAGNGSDGLFGQNGNDHLLGRSGNDRIWGNSGDDTLYGGYGADTLRGGSGFDTLDGGNGNDELWGNFNADTFVFADSHGADTIHDFDAASAFEKIDFRALSTLNDFADVIQNTAQIGDKVLLNTSISSQITLMNVVLSDLDSSDFIF